MAEEGAGRCIVADGPVLVEITFSHHDRQTPGEPSIGRTADEHIDPRRIPTREETEGGDQPDFVLGIEGNRGIAGSDVWTWRCRDGGYTWQEAIGKGIPAVGGFRETDVSSSGI